MDKKREQELREQYRIWKEEEIKWQERQEKENRRAKLWEEYEKMNGTGVVKCPYCKGWGFTLSNRSCAPSIDCSSCNRTGYLDTRVSKDKKTIIDYLEFHSKN